MVKKYNMVNKSNKEELFYLISGSLNKEESEKLTEEISIYIEKLYKKRLKKDIDLFDNVIEKFKSSIDDDPHKTSYILAKMQTLSSTKNIWVERIININENLTN